MMINKRLINLCSESQKYIKLTVLVNWISIICNIFTILIVGEIINGLININRVDGITSPSRVVFQSFGKEFIFIAVLLLIRFISNLAYGHFSHKSSAMVKVKLRDMIYDKLLKLGLNYNEVSSTSSIVQAAIEGVEALEIYFGRYLPQLFYSLLAPITLFIVLSFISLKAAIVFILCVPLIPLSIIAIMKIAKRILKNYWQTYSNLGDTFLDNLQGLTTLKVFNIDEQRHNKMNEEAENFRKVTMKVLSMQLNSITVMDLIAFGGAALGSIVALFEFKNGVINIGETLVIILLSSEFFIPLRLLGSFFHVAMNGMAASDKIFKLLDSKERENIKDKELEEVNIDNDNQYLESIEIRNITFSYDNKRDVLKDVSINIPKKSFVAIVGESGSGKSTIASLLLNNHEVKEGEILLKGKNINFMQREDVYGEISLISTNSYIFNGTILDNLLIGKTDATNFEIDNALRISNLREFIDSLNNGLNTNVGEGGSLLSGGQKQRLALARAILANRGIMIFDEATSNIDIESEELIWKSINILAKEKTIIVISHRLANVIEADNIYVLNKGEIIESGNHIKLMNNKNKYFKMIKEQESLESKGVM
ncbi:ABC transporter ATP-binding protein/permease [Clostridium carnis]